VLGNYLEEGDVARHDYDEVARDLVQLATGAPTSRAPRGTPIP